MEENRAYRGFVSGPWKENIDVRDFIQRNYTPYEGDESFLALRYPPHPGADGESSTGCLALEQEFGGVLDIDTETVSSLTSYAPGYLDREKELIVGLQTNRPLQPGGRTPSAASAWPREPVKRMAMKWARRFEEEFTFRTTHNDGVFRVYTDGDACRPPSSGVITGLPDAYGRGRIIGDYRRVALYGVDRADRGKTEG